jgi:putative membrane protein
MKRAWIALAAASLVIGATQGLAQRIPISSTGHAERLDRIALRNGLNQQDMTFLRQAADINMAEIMLGKLAQERGSGWAKDYGADMQREHSMALEELKPLAQQKGVGLPSDISMKHQQLYNRLARMSGGAFDSAYRAAMISGHGQAASAFGAEIQRGHDEMVRDFAVKMLPAVRMHQKLAQEGKTMKTQ